MLSWWVKASQSFGETVRMRSDRAAYVSIAEARRQEATVRRALDIFGTQPGALIADDVGMGKTYEALALAALALAHGETKKVYILTPGKPVRRKWEEDLYQFANGNVLDEAVRDQLRRALAVIKRERDDDEADDDEADAEPKGVARVEYMERLLREAQLDEPGILFLHKSMLVGNPTTDEKNFFVTKALRAEGRNTTTIKPLMKRWGLKICDDAPGWLVGMSASGPVYADVEVASQRAAETDSYRPLLRASRNAYIRNALPEADLLIVDEAHGLSAKKYGEAASSILRPLAQKVLLLSATPFQTSPHQIEDLIDFLWEGELPTELEDAGATLSSYVSARDALRDAWNELEDHELKEAREVIDEPTRSAFGGVERVRRALLNVREQRKPAVAVLSRFIVRSVRREKAAYRLLRLGDPAAPVTGAIDDDGLVERRGTGIHPGEDELLVLAAERLLRELRRGDDRTFVAQIRQNATSSYAALLDWIKEGLRANGDTVRFARAEAGTLDADTGFYARLVRDLVEGRSSGNDGAEHPKVEAVAAEVARNAARGEKTLVFCARNKTVSAIVSAANAGLSALLHQRYGADRTRADFDRERERLKEDLRYDSRRLGVLLRENPVRTVLPRLLGMPCVPIDLRVVDDELIDSAMAALDGGRMSGDVLIHACARVVLRRIESSSWRHRAASRWRALSESEVAMLSQLHAAPSRADDDPAERSSSRTPSRTSVARICAHLLHGPDVFGPFAVLLAGLNVKERPLAVDAIRLALTTPVLLSPLVATYTSAEGDDVLARVAAALQEIALASGRAVERMLSPGIGDRHDRLSYAAMAYRAGDAVVALDSSDETEERRQMLFNAPFYPLCVVATQKFGQGIDLHRECSRVIHHDGHWNPAVIEQRTGRIDRIHSRTARLREVGELVRLYVDHPFIAGTVDEQILLRSFERASWYDALLGGQGLQPPKDEKADDQASETIFAGERRFPYRVAQDLAIDLSPAALLTDGNTEQLGNGVFSPWPQEVLRHGAAKTAELERLLRALAYDGYLLSEEKDGALVLEGVVGVSATVRVRATLPDDALVLMTDASRVSRSLDTFATDADLYGHFLHFFMTAAAEAERAAVSASRRRQMSVEQRDETSPAVEG